MKNNVCLQNFYQAVEELRAAAKKYLFVRGIEVPREKIENLKFLYGGQSWEKRSGHYPTNEVRSVNSSLFRRLGNIMKNHTFL